MPCTMELHDDVCRIGIEGEMTVYNAFELKQELTPCLGKTPKVELDLSQVNELDSAGLQLLILLKREASKRGIRLALTAHSHAVTEVIDLFNMAAYFGDPIVQPREAA